MAKQKQIDYQKELELVTRADEVAELINKTIGKLSPRNARCFLSGIENAVKKNSVHWRKIEGVNDKAYVLNGLRERVPRLNLKAGELASVKDIADLLNYNPNSTFNALWRLQDELDISFIRGIYTSPNNPREVYVLSPEPEESYQGRIPIVGKPVLNHFNLIWGHGITIEEALKLEVPPTNHNDFGKPRFYNFGNEPKVVRECMRELAAKVRTKGYAWKIEGSRWSGDEGQELSKEEGYTIFDEFVKKTRLPVGTIEGEPVLVYHPKMIRQKREK